MIDNRRPLATTPLSAAHLAPAARVWPSFAGKARYWTIGFFSFGLGLCADLSVVAAHSWYPPLCCNEIDCAPIDRIEHLPDGSMKLTVGHFEVIVPPGFPVMPSDDDRAHVCTYRNMAGQYLPRCLFLPGIS